MFATYAQFNRYLLLVIDAKFESGACIRDPQILSSNRTPAISGNDNLGLSAPDEVIDKITASRNYQSTLLGEGSCQCTLFLGNGLTSFQKLNMSGSNVGNNTDVRCSYLAQWRNLTRMIHAHLPDTDFVSLLGRENTQGQTNMIV